MRLLSLLACAAMLAIPITAFADNGNAGPTMSFFSGGYGGHADWLATSDQPPGDTDNQAIRLLTVNDAAGGYAKGYAGILFHHVTGIPAEEFPDSEFWNKTPDPYPFEPATEPIDDLGRGGTRREDPLDAFGLELPDVGVRYDPTAEDEDVFGAALPHHPDDLREERHVGARVQRQPDRVGVLLDRGLRDLFRGLVQPRVDHLEPGIPERSGDDLRTAVVPV